MRRTRWWAIVAAATLVGCSGHDGSAGTGTATTEPGQSSTSAATAPVTSPPTTDVAATEVPTADTLDPLPPTGDVRFHLPSGADGPTGVVPAGKWLFTVNEVSSNLTRVDPSTGSRENVELPESVVSPSGAVFDGTSLWVQSRDVIVRVDPETGSTETADEIGAPGDLSMIDGADGRVWFVDNASGELVTVGASTGTSDRTALPADGMLISSGAFVDGALWLMDFYGNGVVLVDTATGTPVRLSWPAGTRVPQGMAVAGGSAWTWVQSESSAVGVAADGSTRAVQWQDGGFDVGLVGSGDDLFLVDPVAVRVMRVDTTTGAMSELPVPDRMRGPIGGTVAGGQLWLVDNVGAALARIAIT